MRELFTMWRNTRMIMLTAVVAALFAAVLIPFKAFVLIPGITEIRPANVLPIAFGLMFGPAGAWGSAIGNLIGDVFGGTFGPGSAFGFLGNFFFGLFAYKLWGNLGPLSSGEEPDFHDRIGRQLAEYVVVILAASAICGVVIAWGLEVLNLFPFPLIAPTITINNFAATLILGPPLLFLIYPRVKDLGLLYPDVLRPEDLPEVARSRQVTAALGLLALALLWLGIGLAISASVEGISLTQKALGAIAFLALLALVSISGSRLPAMIGARR